MFFCTTLLNYYPYVKLSCISQDGITPLYVCYNYNKARRRLIATGYSIKPIYWDDKKKWIERASPKFEEINFILTKITSKLGKILTHAKDNAIDPIVDYVLLELKKDRNYEQHSNRVKLFDSLDKYIEEKAPFVYKDQVKDYKTMKKYLAAFKKHSSQPVTFHNLNLKFYNKLMNDLFYETVQPNGTVGLVTNSAGKIVRLLIGFVNYQMSRGIIPSIDLKCFKVIEEKTDAIYLTKKELDKIYKLKLSDDDELEQIRDMFIDGCYFRLRYIDLSSLNKEHIDLVNGNTT